jgi:hypothetical protein
MGSEPKIDVSLMAILLMPKMMATWITGWPFSLGRRMKNGSPGMPRGVV